MKRDDSIDKFMTFTPHTVNAEIPLDKAYTLMKQYQVRHLPVLSAGKLVGILTERDVFLARALEKDRGLRVEDAMTPEPYSVLREASLAEVANDMAVRNYGSAVVRSEEGAVCGIFTAVDALRALGEGKASVKQAQGDRAEGRAR